MICNHPHWPAWSLGFSSLYELPFPLSAQVFRTLLSGFFDCADEPIVRNSSPLITVLQSGSFYDSSAKARSKGVRLLPL